MQIILREDVDNLGRSGDVVKVRAGYARNFLLPRGLALPATPKDVRRLEHEKKSILARAAKVRTEARAVAERIEALTVNLPCQVGEEGRLFGSVTARDVADALRGQGVEVSRKSIDLPEGEPIKALGVYTVDVRLAREVTAKLKVWVVAKE